MNSLPVLRARFHIDGINLCWSDRYGNLLTIPVGEKAIKHPITKRIVTNLNKPVCLNPTMNIADHLFIELVLESYISGLLWVLYRQTKSFRKTLLEDFLEHLGLPDDESIGQIYNSELNLCFACLDFWDSNNLSEKSSDFSALDTWERLIAEDVCNALNSCSQRGSKDDDEKQLQFFIDSFDRWENPNSPKEFPHHFNLIDSAIDIGKHRRTDNVPMRKARKRFREVAWKAYKQAWKDYKQSIHIGGKFKKLHIDGEILYVQMTRRTRIPITRPPLPGFAPNWGGIDLLYCL